MAGGSSYLTKLCLDNLFVGPLADLYYALVVTFARFGNAQNVLARGNICENDSA